MQKVKLASTEIVKYLRAAFTVFTRNILKKFKKLLCCKLSNEKYVVTNFYFSKIVVIFFELLKLFMHYC